MFYLYNSRKCYFDCQGWKKNICFLAGLLLLPVGIFAVQAQDVTRLPPCLIQGSGFNSAYVGREVTTYGIVFADLDETSKRGFFIQDENCDGDSNTSDGIFIYTAERNDVVNEGDWVEITGVVQEYYGMTEVSTTMDNIRILSRENTLPFPVELNPPMKNEIAQQNFESLEGMNVSVTEGIVIGPTNDRDETWIVNASSGVERVFQDNPSGTGGVVCVDDGGFYEIAPEVNTGDHIFDLRGVVEYTYGLYRLQLLERPVVEPRELPVLYHPHPCGLYVATFNLHNLFDPLDDPEKSDPVLSVPEYQRRLAKLAKSFQDGLGEPLLLAVQEVENEGVLKDLLATSQFESDYAFILEEGLDERGIDLALLYRTDRVQIYTAEQRQGCTQLIDGLGPDGNGNVTEPQNAKTCDTDEDGIFDGNRLFSRPPLLAHVRAFPGCGLDNLEIWIIVNHFKSKGEDTAQVAYTSPRRQEQAAFVVGLYQEIIRNNSGAQVLILGDLNDYPDSLPVKLLLDSGLVDLTNRIRHSNRYTYIYQGISQVLDYIWANQPLAEILLGIMPVHINADYADPFSRLETEVYRSSDHDPILAWFGILDGVIYLPLIRR